MRKPVGLFTFLAILLQPLANAAHADYVLYLRSFGEWTVICALDEPTQKRRCRLSAPTPSLTAQAGAHVRVDLVQDSRDRPQVEVRVRHVIDTARPLSLQVDGAAAHQVLPPRTGEAAWVGADAAAIVAEMATGKTLGVRFFEPGGSVAREKFFALGSFPEALTTFREVVRKVEHGG